MDQANRNGNKQHSAVLEEKDTPEKHLPMGKDNRTFHRIHKGAGVPRKGELAIAPTKKA